MTPTPHNPAPSTAPPTAPPADPRAGERVRWRVDFRNSIGHTVAHHVYDGRHDAAAIADRVTSDLGIYFSWLIKDALVHSPHGAHEDLIVDNPAHTRVLADLDRLRSEGQGPERGDG